MEMAGQLEDEPLVSVLMASYNSSAFIEETLDSALGQSYERLEVIVADDCSTDSTTAIVRDYARRDPGRVKLIEGQARSGPCRRRNDALAVAHGSLIAWLDADDLWMRTKVERQVRVMGQQPDVGLVHTAFEAFDSESGNVVPGGVATARGGDLLRPLFVEGDFIASVTAMFRREALDRTGGRLRDSEFAYGDDYWAWLAISLRWTTAGIDEVLARYRIHGANLSFQQGNHYVNRVQLLKEFVDEFPEARGRLGRWRRIAIGRHYLSAAAFEAQHGGQGRAIVLWLQGAIRNPLGALGKPMRRVLSWGGRVRHRLGLASASRGGAL